MLKYFVQNGKMRQERVEKKGFQIANDLHFGYYRFHGTIVAWRAIVLFIVR